MNRTLISTVDELGRLQAKIAEMQAQEKTLKAVLRGAARELNTDSFQGRVFKASIITSTRDSVSWKAVAECFDPSVQLVAAHTKTTETVTVRLTAKPTSLKAA